MTGLDTLFHKTLAHARLDTGNAGLEPWPSLLLADLTVSIPGGAAAAARLLSLHPEAMVLAAGPLTGTTTPGSALLVASVISGISGTSGASGPGPGSKAVHVPLLLRHGPALKGAGVDFLVVSGRAPEPAILVLESGRLSLEPAGPLLGLDIPRMRTRIQSVRPDSRLSLFLCGPAGQAGSGCASVGLEAGGSLDRGSLAGWMARHNLLAVALGGGGPLPGAAWPPSSLFGTVTAGSGPEGFVEVLGRAGGENHTAPMYGLGRPAACHLCPRPCLAFLKPGRDGGNGMLCLDHAGLAALRQALGGTDGKAGRRRQDGLAREALHECMRLGLDPTAVAPALTGLAGRPDSDVATVLSSLAAGKSPRPDGPRSASDWPVPVWPYTWASERLAAGLVLGVCPILLQRSPDVPLESWLGCLGQEGKGVPLRDRLRAALAVAGLDMMDTKVATG